MLALAVSKDELLVSMLHRMPELSMTFVKIYEVIIHIQGGQKVRPQTRGHNSVKSQPIFIFFYFIRM